MRTAPEMFDLGESIMRQELRRTYPDASKVEIEAKVHARLSERSGAEHGGAPGRVRHAWKPPFETLGRSKRLGAFWALAAK